MNQKFLFCLVFLLLFTVDNVCANSSGEMSVDLLAGSNWIGIPGKLYDHNNVVIDSVSDFAAYLDYLDIVVSGDSIGWFNPCIDLSESYSKLDYYPFWDGTDFDIYSGQGISINVNEDRVLPLKFEYISNNHTICENVCCEIIVNENNTGDFSGGTMDIIFFLFFIFVALFLSFVSYFIPGGIGLGLAWLGGAMMILTAIKIGTGEVITIVSNGSVVTLDIGLDRSHIFILFILFAILIIVSNSYIVLIRGTK